MMDYLSMQQSVATLVQRLGDRVEDAHGFGFMSPAIYDTAWVSMISKTVESETTWLFPQCFDYILSQQLEDGAWAIYASEIDGILNTAASLLSLKRHFKAPYQITSVTQEDIAERIDRAGKSLQNQLNTWNVDTTLHVGFEILVPALLRYLEEEDMTFAFPGRDRLLQIETQKLAKFKAEYLYLPIQSTALHSLEAFVGVVDFDKVSHHKVSGSFMASPSSTAAFLMHASQWDDECERYLENTIYFASGQGSGGVPSAFPSGIFEITWPISTLLKVGYDLNNTTTPSIQKVQKYLRDAFVAEKGVVGFTPFVGADADDTANTILVLGLLNEPVSPQAMLLEFEENHHFKTYAQERNPSFSANCNVLLTLIYTPDPSAYSLQIEKAIRFLHKQFTDSDLDVRDKWNLSPYYSWMLMAQAIDRLATLKKGSQLPDLPHGLVETDLVELLLKIASSVVQRQNTGGSWGTLPSKEETAYAVLILTYAVHANGISESSAVEIKTAIHLGSLFLLSESSGIASERLWVEKVTYRSQILSDAYVLAALKRVADLTRSEIPQPIVNDVSTNGTNEHSTFSNHANGSMEENGPISVQPNGNKENGIHHEHVTQVKEIEANAITVSNGHGHSNGTSILTHSDHSENSESYYHRNEWKSDQEEILLGPFDYLENLPGKNIRSQLIQAFNTWLKVPEESLEMIQRVISMLHTASLLIDDIQDQSLLRRGQPVAHSIFGTAQTMNSGNYIYFIALREIQKLQNPQANNIYVNSLIDLHRGQGMELFWRDSLICPTEEEYLDMVANKTGGLFCLAVQLMLAEATVHVDFVPLVRLLGIIFQICDDYLNLKSTAYTDNKGLCEDLTEGKFSFPIIHSIRANPGNRQLINILKQKPREDDVKRYALSYMESTDSFEYTRNVVKKLKAEALEMIHQMESQGLNENIGIRKILARMSLDL